MQQLWPFIAAAIVSALLVLGIGRKRIDLWSVALDVIVFAAVLTFLAFEMLR